jgi:hypothetical protein
MPRATAQELIVLAAARLAGAEAELTQAMSDTPKSNRADKSMVSDRLRLALAEILAAKRALSELLRTHPRIGGEPTADVDDV